MEKTSRISLLFLFAAFALGPNLGLSAPEEPETDGASGANEETNQEQAPKPPKPKALSPQAIEEWETGRAHRAMQEFAQYIFKLEENPAFLNLLKNTDRILNDYVINHREEGLWKNVTGRDTEVGNVLDVLIREKNKMPLVVGDSGTGKTAVIYEVVRRIVEGELPDGLYAEELKDLVILETSTYNIMKMAGGSTPLHTGMGLENYIKIAQMFEKELFDKRLAMAQNSTLPHGQKVNPKRIAIRILDAHNLSDAQIAVLAKNMDTREPMPFLLEGDANASANTVYKNEGFTRKTKRTFIQEFTTEQVSEMLNQGYVKGVEKRYSVKLNAEMVEAIADISSEYRPGEHQPSRSLVLLEDFAVEMHRQSGGRDFAPEKRSLYSFVAKQAGIPVVPQDREAFHEFMEATKEKLKERVIGQDHIVNGLVDQFSQALSSRGRKHSVALLMGPTGVGKTYTPEELAMEYFGSKNRVLELDMTQYTDEWSASGLFGATNGLISSDTDKGAICEYLDGRGRGGGIIIFNEIEKAHSGVFQRLMELLDKGEVRGGDTRVRRLGRHLLVFTSNRNTDRILPYEVIKGLNREQLNARLARITQDDLKSAFTQKTSYTENASNTVQKEVMERIDRLYFASPLLEAEAIQIAQLEVGNFLSEYESGGGIGQLEVGEDYSRVVAQSSYSQASGVRDVRRTINDYLTKAVEAFEREHGYNHELLRIDAETLRLDITAPKITVTDASSGDAVTIDGPKIEVENAILDPAKRKRLKELKGNLQKEVFGQDEAIDAIVDALKAKALRPKSPKPPSLFLIGPTGTGKTQLGKDTAKHFFGDETAYEIFSMGEVTSSYDMHKIFSPATGIIGSDQPQQLERALIAHPGGAVLIFDEMSNAGGRDLALKEEIGKMMYTLMNEGIYTSPSGTSYDLRNYLLLFTGNDGEELFFGFTEDDMLEEVWKDNKSPARVEQILRESGLPAAFLGRVNRAVLTKPPSIESKIKIAGKLLKQWQTEFGESQPFDIEFHEDFIKELAELLYTQRKGARSIETFINSSLGSLIADAVFEFDFDKLLETGERGKVLVAIRSIRPDKPFYEDKPAKKAATLGVSLHQGGEEIFKDTLNFTNKASFMAQTPVERAKQVAYHEMGHAVVNDPLASGIRVKKITNLPAEIGPGRMAGGYTAYDPLPTHYASSEATLIQQLAGLMAGSLAESKLAERLGDAEGEEANTGRGDDIRNAGKYARQMILDGKIYRELDVVSFYYEELKDPTRNNGVRVNLRELPEELQLKVMAKAQHVMDQAKALSERILEERWHVVEQGVAQMMDSGVLNQAEFEDMMGDLLPEEAKINPELDGVEADAEEGRESETSSACRTYLK